MRLAQADAKSEELLKLTTVIIAFYSSPGLCSSSPQMSPLTALAGFPTACLRSHVFFSHMGSSSWKPMAPFVLKNLPGSRALGINYERYRKSSQRTMLTAWALCQEQMVFPPCNFSIPFRCWERTAPVPRTGWLGLHEGMGVEASGWEDLWPPSRSGHSDCKAGSACCFSSSSRAVHTLMEPQSLRLRLS